MIKFWAANDFIYIKKFGTTEPFGYSFDVNGESFNYLSNKYDLHYPDVFVDCYEDGKVYVGSRQYDDSCIEYCDCEEDDAKKLYGFLESTIREIKT